VRTGVGHRADANQPGQREERHAYAYACTRSGSSNTASVGGGSNSNGGGDKRGQARMRTNEDKRVGTCTNEQERAGSGTSTDKQGRARTSTRGEWVEYGWVPGGSNESGDVHERARTGGSGYEHGQGANEHKRGVRRVWMGRTAAGKQREWQRGSNGNGGSVN
jgi:hypothetical protein